MCLVTVCTAATLLGPTMTTPTLSKVFDYGPADHGYPECNGPGADATTCSAGGATMSDLVHFHDCGFHLLGLL